MPDRPARLPSLTALRAFEAAARHGSLSKAADELAVTPGAVSHQIRALEEDLGVPLLRRDGRSVSPTPEGHAGLAGLRRGFEALSEGVQAIRSVGRPGGLTVSVAPSFASLWLIPRLDRFWRDNPDVDVRIDTKWGKTDFRRDNVDLAIRYGPGGYAPDFEQRLFYDSYFPVCSPDLPSPERPLANPEDLKHHVLLHVDMSGTPIDWPDWRMWLTAAGVADLVEHGRGPRFYVSDLAIRAAVRGHGVVLGSEPLVQELLDQGLLIRPFDLSLPVSEFGYWIVSPPERLERPPVRAFADFLVAEVAGATQP